MKSLSRSDNDVDYSIHMQRPGTAVSLFSSGGIGDLALRAAGYEILVSNELLEERHSLFKYNFPEAESLTGDIWSMVDRIESAVRRRLEGQPLNLLYATPPCQGMSKNGRGKLLSEVRAGRKPPLDERNRLIVPTMELASRLRPEVLLFENVPEMADTIVVDGNGEAVQIVELIRRTLGPEYVGGAATVEFADYGVPQRRQRLITIFSRTECMRRWWESERSFLPAPTHSQAGRDGTRRWVSVREAIGSLPPLDAATRVAAKSSLPFHRVPLLDAVKYWWVCNTKPERSAFDNQCVSCGWDRNPTHIAGRDASGVNRASTLTPLYCERCGKMLPRPSVERAGQPSIMRGFTSAYKRMSFDRPASALTRNLSYACSDNKLHPEQHRVLSLHEAFELHTISRYDYEWKRRDGRRVSDKTIREVIGESVPPAGLQCILEHLNRVHRGSFPAVRDAGFLFAAQPVGMS